MSDIRLLDLRNFSWLSKTFKRQIKSIKIHCLLGPNEVSRAQQSRTCWAIPPEQKQVIVSSTDYDQKVGFVNLGGNIHHLWLCPSDSFSERPTHYLVSNGAGMNEGSVAIPICSVSSSATWVIWPNTSTDTLSILWVILWEYLHAIYMGPQENTNKWITTQVFGLLSSEGLCSPPSLTRILTPNAMMLGSD